MLVFEEAVDKMLYKIIKYNVHLPWVVKQSCTMNNSLNDNARFQQICRQGNLIQVCVVKGDDA